MNLIALDGTPLVSVGIPLRQLHPSSPTLNSSNVGAVNAAVVMIGQVFTADGASHTIDTTGLSSLGWRTATVTFASGSTTVRVGLAAVDSSNGPPARAVNASDVITFDVNASFTGGGGGITSNAWQESVPTSGSKTIANGDLVAFAVQMTARGGADNVTVGMGAVPSSAGQPAVTSFSGSVYSDLGRLPNAVITFSDGTRGYFYGGYVASATPSQAWNNTSGTKEYGNLIQLPFPAKAYGLMFRASIGAGADAVLYSDPLGTPVAEKTISFDANQIPNADAVYTSLFAAPFSMAANTPYAAILKPTTTTNVTMLYKTFGNSAHQNSESGGNGYAINRNTGAFAAQNSSLDRFMIGLLIGAFGDNRGQVMINSMSRVG